MKSALSAARRSLARQPAVTATVLLILGVGVGTSTAMLSVVRGVLVHSVPYARDGELVQITSAMPQQKLSQILVALPRFEGYASESRSFSGFAAYGKEDFSLTDDPAPVSVEGAHVSPGFFQTLEITPIIGRDFSVAEQTRGGPHVAIIDDRLWKGRFGGAADILQKSISVNGEAMPIVGVVPGRFAPPLQGAELFLPRIYESNFLPPEQIESGAGYLRVIARLAPGVTVARARGELQQVADDYRKRFSALRDASFEAAVDPLGTYLFGSVRDSLVFLWLAGTFVFLIACANAGNVLLARYLQRQTELDVRAAIGATRRQLLAQLLAECSLLAAGGVALGLLIAVGIRLWLTPLAARVLLTERPFAFDAVVFALAALLGTLAVFIAGAIPALQTTRARRASLLASETRAATTGRGALKLRHAFIVAQIAVSFVLLAGALQQMSALLNAQRLDRGFDARGLTSFRVAPSALTYPTPDSRVQLYSKIEESLSRAPGVSAVGASQAMPVGDDQTIAFIPESQHARKPEEWPHAQFRIVTAGYAPALGLSLHRGRLFSSLDSKDGNPVVLINETLARKIFDGSNPLGTNMFLGSNPVARQIVGVVSDVREQWLVPEASPAVYVPAPQLWVRLPPLNFLARSSLAPAALLSAIRTQVAAVDPAQGVTRVQTMTAAEDIGLAVPRMRGVLVVGFALLGLMFAAVGLWSVMSQLVAERTREIGIRMALGASPASSMRLMLQTGLSLSAIGVGLGFVLTISMGGITQHALAGVERPNTAMLAAAGLLLVVIGAAATVIPARRAARISPRVSLNSR